MMLANQCGIETAEFDLMSATQQNVKEKRFWLRQSRFDSPEISDSGSGRLHMISADGLLDASFREPSLDYIDLVKATESESNKACG